MNQVNNDPYDKELAAKMAADPELNKSKKEFIDIVSRYKYSYNYRYMGRPIIQFPQDMIAMQELVWNVKPDLIIETGIAHGGSLIMNASYLAMLDYVEATQGKTALDPANSKRKVLGIDIDIRAHNKKAIEEHPLSHMIEMIQGSSIENETIENVHNFAKDYKTILVSLDSNHTHDHVLSELKAYAPLTSKGSYCIVYDTVVEDMPEGSFPDRPWDIGNNPKTAVWEYLKYIKNNHVVGEDGQDLEFDIDKDIENKLVLTVAPDGYLKRI